MQLDRLFNEGLAGAKKCSKLEQEAERILKLTQKEAERTGEISRKSNLETLARNTELLTNEELNAPIERIASNAIANSHIGGLQADVPIDELSKLQAQMRYNNL